MYETICIYLHTQDLNTCPPCEWTLPDPPLDPRLRPSTPTTPHIPGQPPAGPLSATRPAGSPSQGPRGPQPQAGLTLPLTLILTLWPR